MGPRRVVLLWGVAILVAALVAPPAASGPSYTVRAESTIAPGVSWQTVASQSPLLSIQQARIDPGAPVAFVPVLSNDRVFENPPDRRTERTTSMCSRAGGVVCVNADFAFCPSCGEPLGAFVVGGRLLRSPDDHHEQVSLVGGRFVSDRLSTQISLVARSQPEPDPLKPLEPPPAPIETQLVIETLNRPAADGIALYSPEFAMSTQTSDGTHEARFTGPVPPLNATAGAVYHGIGGFNSAIPADGYVLAASGQARERLDRFVSDLAGSTIELRVASNLPATISLGGHPVILRDGVRVAHDMADGKISKRHPRTLIGWNDAGATWVIAIDGRRAKHSEGVTMAEAADYLQHLGATDAVNLDGGGSTTFVTARPCANGTSPCIRNRPSDGSERYVVSALAIVSTAPPPPPPPSPPPPLRESVTSAVSLGAAPALTAPSTVPEPAAEVPVTTVPEVRDATSDGEPVRPLRPTSAVPRRPLAERPDPSRSTTLPAAVGGLLVVTLLVAHLRERKRRSATTWTS